MNTDELLVRNHKSSLHIKSSLIILRRPIPFLNSLIIVHSRLSLKVTSEYEFFIFFQFIFYNFLKEAGNKPKNMSVPSCQFCIRNQTDQKVFTQVMYNITSTCISHFWTDKKLSYRRVTARCVLSVVILPTAMQQCRNYLYDMSWPNWWLEVGGLVGGNVSWTMCTQPWRDHVGSHCLRCHKQTDDGRIVYITCIPTTCCGEIF